MLWRSSYWRKRYIEISKYFMLELPPRYNPCSDTPPPPLETGAIRSPPPGFIDEEGGTVEQFQRECKEALGSLKEYSPQRLVHCSGAHSQTTYVKSNYPPALLSDRHSRSIVLSLVSTKIAWRFGCQTFCGRSYELWTMIVFLYRLRMSFQESYAAAAHLGL